ncbi:hypothetical protein ABZP36_001078 [Zizania latifolia]
MHDISGQTAVIVVHGPGPKHPSMPPGRHFGDTTMMDDLLTEGPSRESKVVGRAQGTYMLADLRDAVLVVTITVLLTDGPYNGSTIVISGLDDVFAETRELAVVGGTGQLRRASGYVLWRTARVMSPVYLVLELDVHASVPIAAPTHWPSPHPRHPNIAPHAGRLDYIHLIAMLISCTYIILLHLHSFLVIKS